MLCGATGQKQSPKETEWRQRSAQGDLHEAKDEMGLIDVAVGQIGEAAKEPGQVGRDRRRGEETGKTKMPEIMAVALKLPLPFAHAPARIPSVIQPSERIGHGGDRTAEQEEKPQNHGDDIGAEMLVGNTEIRQKTDRTAACRAAISMDAEGVAGNACQDHAPQVMPMIVQASGGTSGKRTLRRSRRSQIAPMFHVMPNIRAERNKRFAWLRGSLGLSSCTKDNTQYFPKPS